MSRSATAAILVVTAVLLAGCGSGEDAGSGNPTLPPVPASHELTVPAAPSGRCMPPNVDNLTAQDTAFEGVVTEVTDGAATLEVTDTFKGEDAEVAHVVAPSEDLQDLLLAVDFQVGETYLVSSLDGQVSVCGLSGPKDDLLADLYEQAYTG